MRVSILLQTGLGAALVNGAVIRSRADPNIKVTYKKTTICETTPGVNAYAGYVTLPATLDPEVYPYKSNIFFWFFESRVSPATAPLALWIQGGPGAASMEQAVNGHNGPCKVNADSKTTTLNPNSWTNFANMLYIDQPVQTGFSYDGDDVASGIFDLIRDEIVLTDQATTLAPNNWTHLAGTFPSQNEAHMANSSSTAARGVYHLLQAWFGEFRDYRRDSISVWSQSYGGHWVPAIASLIMKEKNAPGSVLPQYRRTRCSHSFGFGVDSAGIINGMVDLKTQLPFFPTFARGNTYGIEAYNETVTEAVNQALPVCMNDLATCQALQAQSDAGGFATDPAVLAACYQTLQSCWLGVYMPYDLYAGRYYFDIVAKYPMGFPVSYGIGYLNQPEVLEALGAKVNYTEGSGKVANKFIGAGDLFRAGYLGELADLADAGVKVALIYGDRDFRCNWPGGEAVSLAVNHSRKDAFAAAGYADIEVNGTPVGKVRQHGLFSFSRVYNAGHEVPLYKPAASLELFKRVILGKDLATGQLDASSSSSGTYYSTTGPASIADVVVAAEPLPNNVCYVHSVGLDRHCNQAQLEALVAGTAVVQDYIVINPPPNGSP